MYLTNSIFGDRVNFNLMFATRLFGFKKDKRLRVRKIDVINEQVRKMLTQADQKLILMVRG